MRTRTLLAALGITVAGSAFMAAAPAHADFRCEGTGEVSGAAVVCAEGDTDGGTVIVSSYAGDVAPGAPGGWVRVSGSPGGPPTVACGTTVDSSAAAPAPSCP